MGLTYIDSCVLIDASVNPDARGERARKALRSPGVSGLATSPLVELECMVHPLRSRDRARIERMRMALGRFKRLEMPPRAYELAAHLRARHELKTADALHVATASLGGCDRIWTSDRNLLRALPNFATDPTAGD